MLTLPSGWEASLISGNCRPLLLFEITLTDDTVLRYSSQAITWNTYSYTAAAISSDAIVTEGLLGSQPRVQESRIVLSNVDNPIRAYIEPVDKLTAARVTIRLILRDAAWSALSGSVVLMRGIAEKAERISEAEVAVRVVGLLDGRKATVPQRALSWFCPWKYNDQVNCKAQNATGYPTCERTPADCKVRQGNYTFGGFAGIGNFSDWYDGPQSFFNNPPYWSSPEQGAVGWGGPFTWDFWGARDGGSSSISRQLIPVIYGERIVQGIFVGEHMIPVGGGTGTIGTRITSRAYLLSEGEIESVDSWELEGEIVPEIYNAGGYKSQGWYYRVGEIAVHDALGIPEDEDPADYLLNPTVHKRPQTRETTYLFDWLYSDDSFVISGPWSRTAWVVTFAAQGSDSLASAPRFFVKGIKIQKYTALGAFDGARVWSTNPVWQVVDLLLNDRYGLGRYLVAADLDFDSIKTAADACDVEQTGASQALSYQWTNEQGAKDRYWCWTPPFERNMTVVFDNGVDTPVEDTVVEIVSSREIRLATARTKAQMDVGTPTIAPKWGKCESGIVYDNATPVYGAVHELLKACRGFIEYNADGKLQIKREVGESNVAHFRDTGAATGYGIIEGSFRYREERGEFNDPTVNRVTVRYENLQGNEGEEVANDWDHLNDNPVNERVFDYKGTMTRAHAFEEAGFLLDKFRTAEESASFMVGPVGLKVQVGDVIQVTHAMPNWSGDPKRVVRTERMGLGTEDEALVRLTVTGYEASVYGARTAPDWNPEDNPAGQDATTYDITLTVDTETNGNVVLTWQVNRGRPASFKVYKSNATMGGVASPNNLCPDAPLGQMRRSSQRYVYTPTADEYGTTLYFMVGSRNYEERSIRVSNEVTVVPVQVDPTAAENSQGANMVYDGDLFSETPYAITSGVIGNWRVTIPTLTDVAPSSSSTVPGMTGFTSPADAYDRDADHDTSAAVGTSSVGTDVGTIWSGFGTGTDKIGFFEVDALRTGFSVGRGKAIIYYSIDGGTEWVAFGGSLGGHSARKTRRSETLTGVNRANLRIKVTVETVSGTFGYEASVYDIRWMEITTGSSPFANIANSQGYLQGDGSDYAEAYRAFPGSNPTAGARIFESGGECVTQVMLRASATPSHDVEIVLRDEDSDTEWNLLTVAKADVPTDGSWKVFAAKYTATDTVQGKLIVVVRCKGKVEWDKIMVTRGDGVYGFGVSIEEIGFRGDELTGAMRTWERGAWSGAVRKATVT